MDTPCSLAPLLATYRVLVKLRFDRSRTWSPSRRSSFSRSVHHHGPGQRSIDEFVAYRKSESRQAQLRIARARNNDADHGGIQADHSNPDDRDSVCRSAGLHRGAAARRCTYGSRRFPNLVKSQIDAGTLRPLLLVAARRAPGYPDLPTAAEKGWNIPRNGWQKSVRSRRHFEGDHRSRRRGGRSLRCDSGGAETRSAKRRGPHQHHPGTAQTADGERRQELGRYRCRSRPQAG